MKIDSSVIDLDNFQSPMFLVGAAPEALGNTVKPLIMEAMESGYFVSLISSYENFPDLIQTSKKIVYHTIGKFGVAPMAINCFEIPNGRQVASHAHSLAAVVGKIFDLAEEDITKLRNAIERAYSKRGWNLLTNTTFRTDKPGYQSELFPRWSDILQEIPADRQRIDSDSYEIEDSEDRIVSVIQDLVGPLNSLVFVPGKTSMQKLCQDNHIFDMSALLPQAQLLAVWCIGLWTTMNAPATEKVTRKRLIVLNLSEEVSRIQEANTKGPMTFHCADEWSDKAAVLTLSRKWNLTRADQFKYGANIVKLDGLEAELQEQQPPIEIDNLAVREQWLASELRVEPLVSYGEKFLPQAFLAELYGSVSNLIASKELYQMYVRYFLAVQNDPTQVIHYREKFISEIQMQLGRKLLNRMHVTWLMLCLCTDRFFREKAERYSWSVQEEIDLRLDWYNILFASFVQSSEKELKLEELNSFRQRLRSLQELEAGPFVGCRFCETRCQFGHEVSAQMNDTLRGGFHSAINRSDEPPSCSGAWSVLLTSEAWIDGSNVDLAYCLAVHQLDPDFLSREANLVMLYKIRETLVKLDRGDHLYEDGEKPIDDRHL